MVTMREKFKDGGQAFSHLARKMDTYISSISKHPLTL